MFRLSVYVRSIHPLIASVSKNVQLLTAQKKFTSAASALGDDLVHMCSEANDFNLV
jgi:hypothetical protein